MRRLFRRTHLARAPPVTVALDAGQLHIEGDAILVAVTGDIGSVTDLAAGLPSLLLQNGYSRDMEREADAYALAWLNNACIPSRRFADLLGRLDKDTSDTGLLDSHPGTPERIRPFLVPGGYA